MSDNVRTVWFGEVIADPERFRPLLNNDIGGVSFSFNIGNPEGRHYPTDEKIQIVSLKIYGLVSLGCPH